MSKISFKKGILDVILYIIVYVVVQLIVMYAGAGIWAIVKNEGYQATIQSMATGGNSILLALTAVFSNVITLVMFLRFRWTILTRDYLLSKPWVQLLWIALFTIGTTIPLSFLYEQLGIEMDDNTTHVFDGLLKEPWGYVAVGILAPLTEEIVFRGAVLRTLLGIVSKKNHWVAIMISAAIFGVAHGNVAQFVNALLVGLVLGWMYYRTKSLVPGILLHWVNNSVAYIWTNIAPQGQDKLIDLFRGDEKTVYYAVAFSLCIMIPSFFQMILRLQKAKTSNAVVK